MSTSSSSRGRLALDLDGTLTDPRPRQVAVLAAVIEEEPEAAPLDLDRLWDMKRGGLSTKEALLRSGVAPAAAVALAARWVDSVEEERWLVLDRPLPGVLATLEEIAHAGERPAILTARRHPDRARAQVASLGLLPWAGEVRVVAPERAAAAKAAELGALGCRALVGDTESDAEAAELAGVGFAAVSTGQRSREFLEARGVPCFDSLREAVRALS